MKVTKKDVKVCPVCGKSEFIDISNLEELAFYCEACKIVFTVETCLITEEDNE